VQTVGVIGGIGPESTIEYYRLLIKEYRARVPDAGYPPVIINSIDLTKVLRLVGAGELEALTHYLAIEVARLARAGADFAVLSSNTPHIVFEPLRRRSPIPLISIVEATREVAYALGLRRVGLFGTRFTMQEPFYPSAFAERGIVPLKADWTNQDPRITETLAALGRNAVPVYALYSPGQNTPTLLPELLTPSLVLEQISRFPVTQPAPVLTQR